MAGSNNFLQFNQAQQNILNDNDYSNHTQRQNGLTNGVAQTNLHNKLFEQLSFMVAAIGDAFAAAGYTVSDVNYAALATVIANMAIQNISDGKLHYDVVGNVTGDVTGNLTGDVTGNLTGTADAAKGDTRFQISGDLGGYTVTPNLSGGQHQYIYEHYRKIPANKKLVLKRASYYVDYYSNYKLQVFFEGQSPWQSTVSYNDEQPEYVLYNNTSGLEQGGRIIVSLYNSSGSPATTSGLYAWWLDLSIE